MKGIVSYINIFLFCSMCEAQESEFNFQLLRQNDSLFLSTNNQKTTLYQKSKLISLGNQKTLSLGGSLRFQTESFDNQQFSKETDTWELWFLNRFMLHAHYKSRNNFEVFAELNTSIISNKTNLSPVDKDELSINQLFARYRFSKRMNVLFGRQNIRLGSGRLVDIREGPNVRLSFDMAQLQYQSDDLSLTAFFAVPVIPKPYVFDNDVLNFNENVSSIYITKRFNANMGLDLYSFYKREDSKTWNSGTANDNRISLGLRHFGSNENWSFDNEFIYQFGTFSDENIHAWTASVNITHNFSVSNSTFGLGIKTELISGDKNPTDNELNTFDGLYPRGAYFGRVARFGPSNLIDIHPYLKISSERFYGELDYVAFWRFSTSDGVYGPPLNLVYPALNNEPFIAQQIGTVTGWKVSKTFTLEMETNFIFPEAFLKDSALDDTLFHLVFTTEFKF